MSEWHRNFYTRYNKVQLDETGRNVAENYDRLFAVLIGTVDEDKKKKPIPSRTLRPLHQLLTASGMSEGHIYSLEDGGECRNVFSIEATIQNIESVIRELKRKMNPEDALMVLNTPHGTMISNKPHLYLSDREILSPGEYKELFKGLDYNFALHYFGNCFGGAFVNAIGIDNNIAISPTTSNGKNVVSNREGDFFANYLLYLLLFGEKHFSIDSSFNEATNYFSVPFPLNFGAFRAYPQMQWQDARPEKLYLRKREDLPSKEKIKKISKVRFSL